MRIIDADAFDECLKNAEIEATKKRRYVFSGAINTIRGNLANAPTIEPQIIRCKNCKYRNTEECPMHYEEWVRHEEGGYIDSDYVAYDQTRDDGFCDRGEEGDDKE